MSAFAPVVHQRGVRVADVSPLPVTTGLSLVRDMKHDIALRYRVGGGEATAVMEVVPRSTTAARWWRSSSTLRTTCLAARWHTPAATTWLR